MLFETCRSRKWLALAVMTLCAATHAGAKDLDCPAFPQPDAKVEWVAQYMVYNGVPMSVKRFDSSRSVAEILAFYRQLWAGVGPLAPVENDVSQWKTISAKRGKCFFTVQVQAVGTTASTGLLSATQQSDMASITSADNKLPMMTGSAVINDIEHRDEGKNARTVLLSNTFSPESNASFYRQTMADQGWKMISSYQMTTAKGPGITIVMKKGMAEASIVITRTGSRSTVLATVADNP